MKLLIKYLQAIGTGSQHIKENLISYFLLIKNRPISTIGGTYICSLLVYVAVYIFGLASAPPFSFFALISLIAGMSIVILTCYLVYLGDVK